MSKQNMTYIEFLHKLKKTHKLWGMLNEDDAHELEMPLAPVKLVKLKWTIDHYRAEWKKIETIFESKDLYLVQQIEVGGSSGGNCWGGESSRYINTEDLNKNFTDFEEALILLCPELTFANFLALRKDNIVKTQEHTEQEYYGDSTDFLYRYVSLKELYDQITKK